MKNNLIGVDIGGTNIRCGVVSKDKKLVSCKEKKIKNKFSKKSIINQLTSVLDEYYSRDIKGIGIGVPALVNLKKGIFYEADNLPGLGIVPLKKILEKRYKIPVLINNDANCFALAEKHFGSARNYRNIVGVIIGTGFGAGLVINNKLYCGNNCAAGEFGKIIFKDKTIEDYCSGKFFIKKYKLTGEELYNLAMKNNKKALNAFNEFGKNLGLGISMVINSIDPEIVVLGGSISKSYMFFKRTMFMSLKKYSYNQVYKNIKIKPSKIKNAGVLGAVSLFFDNAHF